MKDLEQLGKEMAEADQRRKEKFLYGSACNDLSSADIQRLAPSLKERVMSLIAEMRAAIPDDVDFTLSFCKKGAEVALEYNDGNTGIDCGCYYFRDKDTLMQSFRETDWDELRGAALQQGGVFDELLGVAADLPINIPSSAEAAKRWEAELVKALKEVEKVKPTPAFTAILRQEGEKVEIEHYKSKEHLLQMLANALTCEYHVLAILENGLATFYPQVESYKRQAIELLSPGSISRAQAEGRFLI
ncbi:MAG: hypothetical protein PHQ04_12375 [Opitutaceae bacterium]|nr:hypothetical protein [Opitutaceae bacterium]